MLEAAKRIIVNFARLIDVKSIMSLAAMGVFVVLALRQVMGTGDVKEVIMLILTFYFAKQSTQSNQ